MPNQILWVNRDEFFAKAIERIQQVDTILDIGCGIVPHNYITPYVYICCEPFHEYVKVLKEKLEDNTDSLFIVLDYDWEKAVTTFKEGAVDTIYLLDVIEHLDKETGQRLLSMTECIARRQVVIFTPLGFVEQKRLHGDKDAWGLNGADWQEHKSGWLPEDFDESWSIIACKDFHQYNNIGERLDEPFGAFWAIKNIENSIVVSHPFYQDNNIADLLYHEGKHVFEILKHRTGKLEQLEQKTSQLEETKSLLEQERAKLALENDNLVNKIIELEQQTKTFHNRYKYLEKLRKIIMG